MKGKFYREKGKIIWLVNSDAIGPFEFSFDKKKIYDFWSDYWDLTDEEREIFNTEYPDMANIKDPEHVKPTPGIDDIDDDEYEEAEVEYEYSD